MAVVFVAFSTALPSTSSQYMVWCYRYEETLVVYNLVIYYLMRTSVYIALDHFRWIKSKCTFQADRLKGPMVTEGGGG